MKQRVLNLLNSNIWYNRFMLLIIIVSIIPLCFKQNIFVFKILEIITTIIFIIDYLLRWYISNRKILYPFTFFAIIDLASILPSLCVINSGFKLFKLFRINKIVKVLKILRYSKSLNLIISVIKKEQKSLYAVGCLAAGYIFLSALIIFQVEPNSFNTFFDAIYWAMVTLTTVGYGDIYPITIIGRIVGMLSSFMGIAIIALPTGIITAGYMCELNSET